MTIMMNTMIMTQLHNILDDHCHDSVDHDDDDDDANNGYEKS